MIKIAPSILAADFAKLGEEIKSVKTAGADIIHLDIMDGRFVPNISFGPAIAALSKSLSPLPHDAHLMVAEPENQIEAFAKTGVEYIVFHIEIDGLKIDWGEKRWVYKAENSPNANRIEALIAKIKNLGRKAGLAVNPPTEMKIVFPYLDKIDLLLLMSVNPGFAGQPFMPEVYDKIRAAAQFRKDKNLSLEIMIDGGVGLNNARELVKAGADILVTGSSFYRAEDRAEFIRIIKS
jgi:ribulose-phosphate 3-epimerase